MVTYCLAAYFEGGCDQAPGVEVVKWMTSLQLAASRLDGAASVG